MGDQEFFKRKWDTWQPNVKDFPVREQKTASRILNELEPHFEIETEVWGRHFSGKNLRIDAIIQPRDKTEWKNKKAALGIEFKCFEPENDRQLGQVNKYTQYAAQAVDYAHTSFGKYGYIYVFCANLYDSLDKHYHQNGARFWMSRIMAQLGVGDLGRTKWHGLTLRTGGDVRIWSKVNGPETGAKYFNLIRKFGAR